MDFTKSIIRLTLIDLEPIRARGIVVEYAVIQILGSNFPLFLGIIMFYNEFGTKENRIETKRLGNQGIGVSSLIDFSFKKSHHRSKAIFQESVKTAIRLL